MLNVPFASTVPSASSATANGLPGTSAAAHAPASRDLVERPQRHARVAGERGDRRLERAAQPAAVGAEDGQADPAGREREVLGERGASAHLRTLVRDLERAPRVGRQPQHPDLAREREHDHREREQPEQGGGEPDRQPPLGRRLRPRQQRQRARTRSRAAPCGRPTRATPARARRSTRTARRLGRQPEPPPARAEGGQQCARRVRGGVDPGADTDRERGLDERSAPPTMPRAACRRAHAVRRERRPAADGVDELQRRRGKQHGPQRQAGEDRHHEGAEGSKGIGSKRPVAAVELRDPSQVRAQARVSFLYVIRCGRSASAPRRSCRHSS